METPGPAVAVRIHATRAENCLNALSQVQDRVSESTLAPNPPRVEYLRGCPETTTVLLIPEAQVGLIIGSRGSEVKRLEQEAGVKISFQEGMSGEVPWTAMGEKVMVVTGNLTEMRECTRQVLEKLVSSPVASSSQQQGAWQQQPQQQGGWQEHPSNMSHVTNPYLPQQGNPGARNAPTYVGAPNGYAGTYAVNTSTGAVYAGAVATPPSLTAVMTTPSPAYSTGYVTAGSLQITGSAPHGVHTSNNPYVGTSSTPGVADGGQVHHYSAPQTASYPAQSPAYPHNPNSYNRHNPPGQPPMYGNGPAGGSKDGMSFLGGDESTPSKYAVKVEVPRQYVPAIIGKQGAIVKQLSAQHRCHIHIEDAVEGAGGDTCEVIIAKGSGPNICRTYLALLERLNHIEQNPPKPAQTSNSSGSGGSSNVQQQSSE
uniref:K Homology domain-containing protein n=1 Tax=Octactis speculum TaxID=3111310 RepID=A0A7S2AYY9_9STRA